MPCILLWSSAVRVHDSQACRKMDATREHISRILELREILVSIKTGFSLVNAAVVCAIQESISGLEPSSAIAEPRYLKLVTVSSLSTHFDLCVDATGIVCHQLGLLSTDLNAVGCGGFVKVLHPLGCLELDFCSSFSKVGLYLGHIVYFSCIIFHSVFFLSFPSSPPPFYFVLFFFWRILIIASYSLRHALLLFSSRQSRALFLPPASWHPTDKDKSV